MPRKIGSAALSLLFVAGMTGEAPGAEASQVTTIPVLVQETAGIRRFGYPVHIALLLPRPVERSDHFRLLYKNQPVTAQFRHYDNNPFGDGRASRANLDFNVSCGPNESRRYVVEYGPDVKPPPPPRGMKVVKERDQVRIIHSPSFQIVVPRDLLGLLRAVKTPKTDYLRSGSAGLLLCGKDGMIFPAVLRRSKGKPPVAALVSEEGPLASTLHWQISHVLGGGKNITSAVEMQFPVSKSWVQVTWKVDDKNGSVTGLGADLNLNIKGEPTLIDFGAGSYVYAHLQKGGTAIMRQKIGDPIWETLVGPIGTPAPYVVAKQREALSDRLAKAKTPRYSRAEGWAHVMDGSRCTAIGLADFAKKNEGAEIAIDADGRLRLWKRFGSKGEKSLRFWLHFVDVPVQVGAVTSPQSMMAPLKITVSETNGGKRRGAGKE